MGEPAPAGQQGHEELLTKLSLADKISLLTGADYWHLRAHRGIGLRRIRTSHGPADVRGPRWDERDTVLNVPAPVALAATWDPRRPELSGTLLTAARTWTVEPGDFQLHISRSSWDVPLSVTVTVSSGTDMPDGPPGGSGC